MERPLNGTRVAVITALGSNPSTHQIFLTHAIWVMGSHQQTSLVTPLLVMAHSSISRTTRFQREKVGASPTWATNFDIHFSIYMEMKISQSNQRLIIYFALTLVASFLGDSTVQMIRNEPIIIEHIHWFQWLCIFLGVFLQLLIVWRSFLDQSKNREEHKRSKKKLNEI